MPDKTNDTVIATVMEQLMAEGPQAMAQIVTVLMNLAMRMEREQFLAAGHYERAPDQRGYANGTKLIDTLAGTLSLAVPKTAGTNEPFYPQALERGRRSCRAVMLAVAEMYVCGVSTRDAERVMAQFGLKSLSSTQVSRAAKLLRVRGCGDPAPYSDDELEAWRGRTLGEIRYLFLAASSREIATRRRGARRCRALGGRCRPRRPAPCPRRIGGTFRGRSPHHGVLGRAFLESLVARGMRGVQVITADDHAGLKVARNAGLGGAIWQRCQFHLAQNAIHHAPKSQIRKRLGSQLREVWNAKNLAPSPKPS